MGYSATRSFSLFYGESFKVASSSFAKTTEFGLGYRNRYSLLRRNVFLNTYLSYYSGTTGFKVGRLSGDNTFSMGGESFSSNRATLFMGTKSEGVKLQVGGSIGLNGITQLSIFGSYCLPFTEKQVLTARQTRSWYQEAKCANISASDNRISYSINGKPTESPKSKASNIYFGVGLLLGLSLY